MGATAPGEGPRRTAGLPHLVQVAGLQGAGKSPGKWGEWVKPGRNPSRDVSLVSMLPYLFL